MKANAISSRVTIYFVFLNTSITNRVLIISCLLSFFFSFFSFIERRLNSWTLLAVPYAPPNSGWNYFCCCCCTVFVCFRKTLVFYGRKLFFFFIWIFFFFLLLKMTASFSNGPDSYLPQSPPFFTLNVSFWTGSIHAPLYSLYSSIMAFAGRQVKTMGRKLYTYCWMGIICFCERFSQWNSFSRPVLLSNCIFQRVIIQSVFRIYCYVGQFNKNCPLFVFEPQLKLWCIRWWIVGVEMS